MATSSSLDVQLLLLRGFELCSGDREVEVLLTAEDVESWTGHGTEESSNRRNGGTMPA